MESMHKHLYIFSGLGADERVFQKLDLSAWDVTFIKWIPQHEDEELKHYATRILPQVNTKRPILIGLSFGGIMAIEVAKQIETERIILISSVKTRFELPYYYRISGKYGFHRLLPTGLMKKATLVNYWFFGARSAFDRRILKEVLEDTDAGFFKWAIGKVATWQQAKKLPNITHIHGTKDRILPFRFVQADHVIKNGGHMMVLNKAEQLNALLREHI